MGRGGWGVVSYYIYIILTNLYFIFMTYISSLILFISYLQLHISYYYFLSCIYNFIFHIYNFIFHIHTFIFHIDKSYFIFRTIKVIYLIFQFYVLYLQLNLSQFREKVEAIFLSIHWFLKCQFTVRNIKLKVFMYFNDSIFHNEGP